MLSTYQVLHTQGFLEYWACFSGIIIFSQIPYDIQRSEPKKKTNEKTIIVPKKISKDDIPSNTLKLIEEAEKNLKN